jgi:hypothetical protein
MQRHGQATASAAANAKAKATAKQATANATAIFCRFGFAFTPAFGRAVFRFAVGSYGTAEAVPLSETALLRSLKPCP